jgi:hypothetical protein
MSKRDDLMTKNLVKQAFELWLNPEIKRRAERGEITLPLRLSQAQILFSVGGKPIVRLNDEVKAVVQAKAA